MPPSKNAVCMASCFPFSNQISRTQCTGCTQYVLGNVVSGLSHRRATSPPRSMSVPIRLDVVVGVIASNKDEYSEKSGRDMLLVVDAAPFANESSTISIGVGTRNTYASVTSSESTTKIRTDGGLPSRI